MAFKNFCLQQREDIEWTNTWIEDSQQADKKRILIIGDSVARSFRRSLSNIIEDSVDFIGSSSSFEDPCFYNILDCFFSKNIYSYTQIMTNIGFHHGLYLSTFHNNEDKKRYETAFEKFINYLQKHCSDIVILLGSPEVLEYDTTKLDTESNHEVESRNNIQSKIAKQLGLKTIDLYNHIANNPNIYPYGNHLHIALGEPQEYIAKFIANELNKKISACRKEEEKALKSVKFTTIKRVKFCGLPVIKKISSKGEYKTYILGIPFNSYRLKNGKKSRRTFFSLLKEEEKIKPL